MSKLDLNMGFHQVPLDASSQEKTAFVTPDGAYEYTRLPFGLSNAPSTFQRLMDQTLSKLKWTHSLVYLDDLLPIGKSFQEHNESLELVLKALLEANLTVKPNKCDFGMTEVEFLGHKVSQEGISVNPEKVKAVEKFPTPKSVKDVRSFVSLCSFYRKFIPFFAKIAKPLNDLMHTKAKFVWTDSQQNAFDELKQRLISAPVLGHYDPEAETELHTDACTYGIGAILMQTRIENGKKVRRTIAYASRTISKAEKNYHVTELECLAVVYGVFKFRHYVYGKEFKVVVDHCSLCHLINLRDPNGRLARWALRLQPYKFTIEYNSGKKHSHVDALSRYPVDKPTSEEVGFDDACLYSLNVNAIDGNDFIGSDSEVLTLQRGDPVFKKVIDSLLSAEDGTETNSKFSRDYMLHEGILYHVNFDFECRLWSLCVPKGMREKILREVHDSASGGHLGFYKTWHTVKSRFWWPNMHQHVRRFLESCQTCQLYSRRNHASTGNMHTVSPPAEVFNRIGIDFIGPLPISSKGNSYVLMMIDHLSRYVEAYPVPAQTAAHAITGIKERIIHRHGIPREIVMDQGKQFISQDFVNFCKEYRIKQTFTSVYSPSSNGVCEKVNDTTKRILAKYVGEDHYSWEDNLPAAIFSYNTSVHHVIKCSPFYVLFGREPYLSCDIKYPTLARRIDDENSSAHRVRIENAVRQAYRNTEAFQEKQKAKFDESHPVRDFEIGDLVMHANFERIVGKVAKFLIRWKGPFRIVDKVGPLTYGIVRLESLHGLPPIVQAHARNLKLYHAPYMSNFDDYAQDDFLVDLPSTSRSHRPPLSYSTEHHEDVEYIEEAQSPPPTAVRRSGRSRRLPDRYGVYVEDYDSDNP